LKVLIDTHIWIWWVNGESSLPSKLKSLLDRSARQGRPPHLSAISLWEAHMLYRKQRIQLEISFREWIAAASDPEVVSLIPLDASVVMALDQLPDTFHGDPADRMIVATAMAHKMAIATCDNRILNAGLVRSV